MQAAGRIPNISDVRTGIPRKDMERRLQGMQNLSMEPTREARSGCWAAKRYGIDEMLARLRVKLA
jgi:hypothetical protein